MFFRPNTHKNLSACYKDNVMCIKKGEPLTYRASPYIFWLFPLFYQLLPGKLVFSLSLVCNNKKVSQVRADMADRSLSKSQLSLLYYTKYFVKSLAKCLIFEVVYLPNLFFSCNRFMDNILSFLLDFCSDIIGLQLIRGIFWE